MRFLVQNATMWISQGGDAGYKKVAGYKVAGYLTASTLFPTESRVTAIRAEADDWAARANLGEDVVEAGWGSYNDD